MRYAIVSDIHANLQAWQATLADIQKVGVHQIICLGDVVGYGPNPQEVYESVREVADGCILGNHDAVVCNRLDPVAFNPNARRIIEWTAEQLTDDAKLWFADVPMLIDANNFQCAHAEFEIPERFRYIFSAQDAAPSFDASDKPLLFVGHTHRQSVFVQEADQRPRQLPAKNFDCLDNCRYLVNVGSVGDPRNGEVAGSYVIVDIEDGTIEFRSVEFDVSAYRDAILKSGLSTRPMLFNFVSGDGFGDQKTTDDSSEEEFKPRDDVLAKAPESAGKAGSSTTLAATSTGAAAKNPKSKSGTSDGTGEADVESIARGAGLLLIPLVIVGAIILATRPDAPPKPTDPPVEVVGTEVAGDDTEDPQPVTPPEPPAEPTPIVAETPGTEPTPAAPPVLKPVETPDPEPTAAVAEDIQWPAPDPVFPGRHFRLTVKPAADSLSAIAEAAVAGSLALTQERANAYLAKRQELADAEEYQDLFDNAVAAAAWQQTLAASYESSIGQTGSIRTLQGDKRVQIKGVATNGLNVRTVLRNGEMVDQFIPFDDLPHDERQRKLTADAARTVQLMHGMSCLRSGLADQAASHFAEAGGLLAGGMQELLNANSEALRTRAAYRALTILYRLVGLDATVPPADVAAEIANRQFNVRKLAQVRRTVDAFRQRFGDTPTATAAEPLLTAIDEVRPRYFTPVLPDPAHVFSLAADSLVEAPGKPDQKVVLDQANTARSAPADAAASTTESAVGELLVLTRQSDCLSASLAPSLVGNPAMTIAFWAKAPDSNATRTPVSLGVPGADKERFAVIFAKTYGISIGERHWDSGIPVRNELWQYHVITRGEGGSLTWWLFDEKAAQGRLPGDLALAESILIGANLGGLNGDRRVDVFRGLLKDLHVYPRILLDDQIRRLGRDARTFAIAARLDNRLSASPAEALPAKPDAEFSAKAVAESKFTMPANGITWQEQKGFPVGTIVGDGAAAGGIAPEAKTFRSVAFVPGGQQNLDGCVFRIRTIPGGIIAESGLVAPGQAVLFDLPLKTTTGRLQLETVFIGSQEASAHWLQPGFYE